MKGQIGASVGGAVFSSINSALWFTTNRPTKKRQCKHCNNDINIRNPSGYCDHLYYPDYCNYCKEHYGGSK